MTSLALSLKLKHQPWDAGKNPERSESFELPAKPKTQSVGNFYLN